MPPTRTPSPRPLVLLLLSGLALATACSRAPRAVRVVVVSIDTLRYDRFRGPDAMMPALELRAEDGLVFTRFLASTSSTQPTHASLFTGLHPWEHGVSRNGLVLGDEVDTMAERLARAGFETAAVVASFPMEAQFGFDQGFDVYVDDFDTGRNEKRTWEGYEPDWSHFYSQAHSVTDRALQALDEATAEKQFFFFHYFDPHSPYGDSQLVDPEELGDVAGEAEELPDDPAARRKARRKARREERRRQRDEDELQLETRDLTLTLHRYPELFDKTLNKAVRFYDRDVAFLDDQLERLFERLDRDAERYQTHIVVTADHGESFGDDLSLGHGDRVTMPQLHVPFFVLSPKVQPAVREDPAGSVDVLATVLSLAGLDPGDAPAGRDLVARPPTAVPVVFGMRRTYVDGGTDLRVTGERVELEGQRFFAWHEGTLYVGDEDHVFTHEEVGIPPVLASTLRGTFGHFERELAERQVVELTDAETLETMAELGYTR